VTGSFGSGRACLRLTLAAACLVLGIFAALAPPASAVLVHGKHGHFFGVTLHRGVKPTALPGSVAAATVARRPALAAQASSSAFLQYQGGPVMHSSAPYLIFWGPSNDPIPPGWQSLMAQYFTDTTKDSGTASNVYAVGRQYTDGSGFADYRKTFTASSQVITDTNAFPATDSACSGKASCVSDAQIQSEISSLIAARNLPTDGPKTATQLPQSAPIYFVVLPSDKDVCYTDPSGTSCASNAFCAYHSSFTNGANNVLYSAIPTLPLQSSPKACQSDGNSAIQQPNGSVADVALKYISHEDAETITDPLANGWVNPVSGYENGDKCNDVHTNANSFTPTLGGSPGGTLYNQTFNGHNYYVQSEWSNWDGTCTMQPTSGTLTSHFTSSVSAGVPNTSFSFTPTGSTSSWGYTSSTWDFGDGATSFAGSGPSTVTHPYATPGHYTATLTLVDNRGNLASSTQPILIYSYPVAAFTFSPSPPIENASVSFNGSSSSDPDPGITVTGYSWDWGDGTAAGSGATPTHTYTAPGTYTVKLTVTNGKGMQSSTSQAVTVADAPPTASFAANPTSANVGQSVALSATASDPDPGETITGYSWDFGDGSPRGTGATPSHSYSSARVYVIALTVTDSQGATTTVTQPLTVGPIAAFSVSSQQIYESQTVSFNGAGSNPAPGSSLTYDWDFGDASAHGTGATPSHTYITPGTYAAKLTVTNNQTPTPQTAQTTKTITVTTDTPAAAFAVATSPAYAGYPVAFDGSSSSDPAGSTLTYDWNWGDGTPNGTGVTPTHTYSATTAKTYTVTLTVTNTLTHSSATQKSVVVSFDIPTAAFKAPSAAYAGYSVVLDGTGSTDPAGATLAYDWNWGDGTAHGTAAKSSHTYASPGPYNVILTVTNTQGHAGTLQKTVTVNVDTPAASFTAPAAYVSEPASFDGTTSTDPAGSSLTYSWNFGDGSATSTGPTTSHTYASTGNYTVTLTATNSQGHANTTTRTVTVSPHPPNAAFAIKTIPPLAGQPIAFDGTASTAWIGSISSYSWSFGAAGPTASTTFPTPGTYPVSLTVTDSHGQSSTATELVTVHAPPSAGFSFSPSAPVDHATVTFDGGGSFSPDSTTTLSSYSWTFGDGSTASGPTATHRFAQPGRYTVQLTVTNSLGLTSTTTQDVTVTDEAPSAGFTLTTARPGSGQRLTFSGASSSDPDGTIVSYRWTFGDGAAATGMTPIHSYAKPGTYTVSLTVTDGSGQSATTSKSVTVGLSGRITSVKVKTGRSGATMLVSVSSAGTLTAGRKTYRVRAAGTVKVPIKLTPAQLRTVALSHRLTVRLALRFVPSAGPQGARSASVTFHSPRSGNGPLAAVVGR
jgi:PKD repeat protein